MHASRPDLNPSIPPEEFKNYYWLKEELVSFCTQAKLPTSGDKIEITERIYYFLTTKKIKPQKTKKKPTSTFDWKKAVLKPETLITDNYHNNENVRSFFKKHIGPHFHFTTVFMEWMKKNTGQTLKKAIEAWQKFEADKKENHHKIIAPQFEYNRYIRDFLLNNPNLSLNEARHSWKRKKLLPGTREYKKSDLKIK